MSDLDDLNYTSILDMDNDEAIELLRQIRLSRRIPAKKKRSTIKKLQAKKPPTIDASMAAKLLGFWRLNNVNRSWNC